MKIKEWKMKKIILLLAIVIMAGILSACDIANGINQIEIDDGFYVINGVSTSIKAKLPKLYAIDENGCLIVTYTDTTTENLGKFGSDAINTIETINVSDDGFYVLNGIKTNISAIDVYDVSFVTGCSQTISKQFVKDGFKVERPQIERIGYTLDGWYCNDEEWHFNTDVVKNDMTLSANWVANSYTVNFENEKSNNPNEITVVFDDNIILPSVDDVIGYTFVGWCYNDILVNGDNWDIADDVTLTAKWEANKYTITLDSNGGNVSASSVVVEYDKDFTLPVPTNSYGVFVGWLYNDTPITDSQGNCLNKWAYLENISATVDWTIKVYTVDDLKKMDTYLNGEFVLMNDIDLADTQWEPIGTQNNPFTGVLNGDGHTINNLSIDTANLNNKNAFGLFGFISYAKIENLVIDNFTFTSNNLSKSYSVGAIAGVSLSTLTSVSEENAPLKNITTNGVYSIAKQSSSYPVYAGGVIGQSSSDLLMNNCFNSINIINATYSGGIVGASTTYLYLIECGNNASINSTQYAGGLVGKCALFAASKCYNNGGVTSVQASGGIVGSVDTYATFEYCYNTGNISSTTDNIFFGAGGLIGCCYTIIDDLPSIEIKDSYNKGNITAPYVGGLCGTTYNIKVTNAYNAGFISGTQYAGGIFANCQNGTIKQCLNAGTISCSMIKSTIGVIHVTSSMIDCYHTNSSTSGFYQTGSIYTTNAYGSTLYKNDMYWVEYSESTNKGQWIFSEESYPKLFWEE